MQGDAAWTLGGRLGSRPGNFWLWEKSGDASIGTGTGGRSRCLMLVIFCAQRAAFLCLGFAILLFI